ncbi:MAG: M1 family peptidase [Chitinophagaceae bacterium]|nr:MAG: M1 family peptidase [Chitinophagaceae bacterium]
MKKLVIVLIISLFISNFSYSQPDRWQQRVKYVMNVDVDVNSNRFTGKQQLEYTNNSPDTLKKVFYHLYWNAFQPNSMMDARSRELGKNSRSGRPDWDPRVTDRISRLNESEIGFQKVLSLKMNGVVQDFTMRETILEVKLSRPILPKSKVILDMEFESQVPVQIRRSGRDAANGVRYSMSQWYPKLCEYDYEGWHPTPYVAREFYGVWGDYDVKINIDKTYILGGTGYLQNPNQIGYGYENPGTKVVRPAGNKLTWHFVAPNVHDFMWAADPEYRHLSRIVPGGPTLHVLYNRDENFLKGQFERLTITRKNELGNDFNKYLESVDKQWQDVLEAANTALPFIEKNFGEYPYKQYSFIHGGDGGMEYPMATLVSGPGVGLAFHEWMHSWYQMMLATNESMYAWMDEGFADFATNRVQAFYRETVLMKRAADNPTYLKTLDSTSKLLPKYDRGNYMSYFNLAKSGMEEPLTTHADHYNTNFAHATAAYSKGAVFLGQLGYITGDAVRDKILLEYYRLWRFKHPNANDFMRVAENVSGMKLDWYKDYFINSTKTIDYGIDSLWEEGGKSKIRLKMIGKMPMPIDLMIQYKDGSQELAYIPTYLAFGEKPVEDDKTPRKVFEAWRWTHPTYVLELPRKLSEMKIIEIDPSQRMADLERRNNKLEIPF